MEAERGEGEGDSPLPLRLVLVLALPFVVVVVVVVAATVRRGIASGDEGGSEFKSGGAMVGLGRRFVLARHRWDPRWGGDGG